MRSVTGLSSCIDVVTRIDFARAARLLITWPVGEAPPEDGDSVPHPRMLVRMVDANAEVQLVGSADVVEAAQAYMDKVWETGKALTEQKVPYNDIIRAIEIDLKSDREAVVDRMRRDLKVRR